MNRKFKAAAKNLFYPDSVAVKKPKEKKIKTGEVFFGFYKFLLIVPVLAFLIYGILLCGIASNLSWFRALVWERISYNHVFIAIVGIVEIAVLIATFSFRKNQYSKSRALRALVSGLCCIMIGPLLLSFLMAIEVIDFTAMILLLFLTVTFLFAVIIYLYIIRSYRKDRKSYFGGLVKRMPIWAFFLACLLVGMYAGFTVLDSSLYPDQKVLKAFNAVYYILTEDEYNLSFGSKNVTQLVSLELTKGKTTSMTSYDAIFLNNHSFTLQPNKDTQIKKNDVFDVKELSKISCLKSVTVKDIPMIKNFSSLYQVRKIEIENCGLEVPRSGMFNLEELSIKGPEESCEEFISMAPYLTSLYLYAGDEKLKVDIKKLTSLTNLETILLYGAEISNAGNLNEFRYLKDLTIKATNLLKPNVELSSRELGQLESLRLNNVDFGYLEKNSYIMTNLKTLYIENGDIKDISALARLDNLESVELKNNNIEDISALSGNTGIEYLDLSDNKIKDISVLSNLKNLTHLILDNNEIEDIIPISGLHNLEKISLANNKISMLPYLSCVKTLERINLDGNKIEDISAFADFENLKKLEIRENPISKEQINELPDGLKVYQ